MKPRYRVRAGSRQVVLADLGRRRSEPIDGVVEVAETAARVARGGGVQAVVTVAIFEDGGVWSGKFFGAGTPIFALVGALEHMKIEVESRIER